ncbi:MAG: MotA/TolQ/ExbB proton channel family protein [Candidatus Omnitrophota bacterium]
MWDWIIKGGVVMWPIILCSVLAFAIILERLIYFSLIKIDGDNFLNLIKDKLIKHQIREAIDICDRTPSPIAKILKAGILKYDHNKEDIREAIEDAASFEIPNLEKNLSFLATLAHISPLLGLLGTVTGMVRCFQTIEAKAVAVNPVDLAGGIWEALITTVAGLIVAIPAYVAYNFMVTKVKHYIVEMERSSTELVNFLLK